MAEKVLKIFLLDMAPILQVLNDVLWSEAYLTVQAVSAASGLVASFVETCAALVLPTLHM